MGAVVGRPSAAFVKRLTDSKCHKSPTEELGSGSVAPASRSARTGQGTKALSNSYVRPRFRCGW